MKKRDLCHESKRPEEPSFTVTNVPSIFEKTKKRERERETVIEIRQSKDRKRKL